MSLCIKGTRIVTNIRHFFKLFVIIFSAVSLCTYINYRLKSYKLLNNNNDNKINIEEIDLIETSHQVREYVIYNFTFSAEIKTLQVTSKICLCTLSSIDHLHWLVRVLENWDGPVSLSVYAPGTDWPIAKAILNYMRRCVPAVRKQVDVHFVYSEKFPPLQNDTSIENTCDDVINVVKKLGSLRNKKYTGNYPQNLLRNTARLNCKSPYVTVLDIDLIPSVGMFGELEKFLNELEEPPSAKNAYIVPSFEMDKSEKFPGNKNELVQLIKKQTAQSFYYGMKKDSQKPTDYDRWYGLNETDHVISAYQINMALQQPYEPYYIARNDNPLFDESLEGFGMNRLLQFYELILAGYNFYVLDPVFVMHLSFHTLKSYSVSRAFEHLLNVPTQLDIMRKLKIKYNVD